VVSAAQTGLRAAQAARRNFIFSHAYPCRKFDATFAGSKRSPPRAGKPDNGALRRVP